MPYNDEISQKYYVETEDVNKPAAPAVNLTYPNSTQPNQIQGKAN